MNEEIRKRDALWCQALVSTLDTVQIEKVTAEFNRLRGEAVEHSVQSDLLPCGHSVDSLGMFGGCNPNGTCMECAATSR